MTRRLRFLWVWTLPLWGGVGGGLLSSCDDATYWYHEYQSTNARGWLRNETLTFVVTRFDTAYTTKPTTASLSVSVRTLDNYPYRTLPLRITIKELLPLQLRTTIRSQIRPDSTLIHADTISRLIQRVHNVETHDIDIPLFDNDDQPQGHGLPHIQHEQTIDSICLDHARRYRIHVTHRLRDPAPEGITDIGIRLKR